VSFSLVAAVAPVIERVGSRRLGNFARGGVAVTELLLFPRLDGDRRSVAASLAFALPNGDLAAVPVGIHIHTVFTRSLHRERSVWSINLVGLALRQIANPQAQASLVQLQLGGVVAHASQGEAALAVHANQPAAHVQFSA
jgi:hypothetical protein